MHRAARKWTALALLFGVWLLAVSARAAPSASFARGGRITLSLPGGGVGPLVLSPGPIGWSGELTVGNAGTDFLTVSRIAIRGDEDDVRSPSHLSVRFLDGSATTATLAPGGTKTAIVSWIPDRDPRMRQAFGHVVVTSTDERSGEVAMGFCAQIPTGLGFVGEHALTVLVLAPLGVVLFVAALWLTGRRDEPFIAPLAIGAAVFHVLLATWAYHMFAADVGRADGNDGYQLVERSVWVRSIGCEWFVGVDGASLPLVVLASIIGLVAVLVACAERRGPAFHAALALLSTGVIGTLVALDLALLLAAFATVWIALLLLVGGWGAARGPPAAAKVAVAGIIGSVALLFAFVALSGASAPTFLADGARVAHTMAVPEIARSSFAARPPIFGMPFETVVWVLLFVPVALCSPLVPFHGWLPDALARGPTSGGIVLGSVVVTLGPYLLVRIGFGTLPEAAQGASATLCTLGALGAIWGSLCAVTQRDLRRFAAYTTIATSSLGVFGLGGLTAEGFAGGMAAIFAHGFGSALLLGLAGSLAQRVRTCDAMRVEGLVLQAPALAGLAVVGLGTSLGVPGLAGSWGIFVTLIGGFVRHPALACVLGVALVVSAVAHIRMARLLLLGRVDPAWGRSHHLEPFGGRLPDASSYELVAFVPLAALAILLGFWPAPVLSSFATSARDRSSELDLDIAK